MDFDDISTPTELRYCKNCLTGINEKYAKCFHCSHAPFVPIPPIGDYYVPNALGED